MRAYGQHYRTIWLKEGDPGIVQAIDQRYLLLLVMVMNYYVEQRRNRRLSTSD